MKTIELSEERVRAALNAAKSEEAKSILKALLGVEEISKPNLDDYKSIKTYEDACKALGLKPILNYTCYISEQVNDGEDTYSLNFWDIPKHIIALMKLETISRALWGKSFQPKPDAEGKNYYYYPWLYLYTKEEIDEMSDEEKGDILSVRASSGAYEGCGGLYTCGRSSSADSNYGFRLFQETHEKAIYFGRQFVKLWAEYLAFNFTVGDRITC